MVLGISGKAAPADSLERVSRQLLDKLRGPTPKLQIASAADGSAGAEIADRLAGLKSRAQRRLRNLNDGMGAVHVAADGLNRISEKVVRMRELAAQAQQSDARDADRATRQVEFDSIAVEISRTAQATEFNGRSLLNGDTDASNPLSLEDGTEYSAGLSIEIDGQSAADLGVEGLDASNPASLEVVDKAIDSVSKSRAGLNQVAGRIKSRISERHAAEEAAPGAESRISDVNSAIDTAGQARDLILSEGDLGIVAQANFMQSAALRLLG